MYAGCLVGSNSVMGSVFSTRRRTDAVQPVSSSARGGAVTGVGATVPGAMSSLIAGPLPPVGGKRCDQCGNGEQLHHADEEEIRQRDENEAPVNVGSRRVHWQPPCGVGVSGASVRVRTHHAEGADAGGTGGPTPLGGM